MRFYLMPGARASTSLDHLKKRILSAVTHQRQRRRESETESTLGVGGDLFRSWFCPPSATSSSMRYAWACTERGSRRTGGKVKRPGREAVPDRQAQEGQRLPEDKRLRITASLIGHRVR